MLARNYFRSLSLRPPVGEYVGTVGHSPTVNWRTAFNFPKHELEYVTPSQPVGTEQKNSFVMDICILVYHRRSTTLCHVNTRHQVE